MRQARTSSAARRALSAVVTFSLVWAPLISSAQRSEEQVELGVKQVEGGDFDAAVITLDAAARALAAGGGQPKQLARAYTYLAIAYLGLSQEQAAKARFLDALKTQPDLRLDPKEFPPKVVKFFEQAKEGARGPTVGPSPSASPSPAKEPSEPASGSATAPPAKKGGSKTLPILLGVGAAAAIGVAVAAGKGSSSTPPTTLVPPPASLSDLSASVTSPEHNANLNCTKDVAVTVTLTNRSRSSVGVTSVKAVTTTVSGGCTPAPTFVITPLVFTVAGGSTATLANGPTSTGGSGCCPTRACSGAAFCELRQTYTVVTSVGDVNAGAIGFGLVFQGCKVCATSAADGSSCAPSVN